MTSNWKLDPQYLELKKDFEKSLAERLSSMRAVLTELEHEGELTESARKFHFIVHKLAGVARSFDFTSLANLTEAQDEYWDQLLSSNQCVDKAKLVTSIQSVMKELDGYSSSS